jgi:hypothetical protein
MNTQHHANPERQPTKPEVTPEIRRYLKQIGQLGGGYRNIPHEFRVLNGKLWAKRGWEIRRFRYGPTGQRAKPYRDWLKEHPTRGKKGST